MITNILVIDDSTSMRELLNAALGSAGYTVTLAADGDEGLEHALAQRFDLVLTDQYMPRMSGLALIGQLRANRAYADTPILMLTTESDENFKVAVREAGATGWIEKPVDPEVLVDLVGALGEATPGEATRGEASPASRH